MRNYFSRVSVFCLAIIALCYSCKKKIESSAPSVFAISGVANTTIDKDSSVTIPLSITQVSGDALAVGFIVSGLPAQVSASFSPVSGTPPFNCNLKLTANNAAVGTYNIVLKGATYKISKDYSFDLTVKETPDCIDASFLGNKQGHDYCTSTQNIYGVYINKDANHVNRIFIMNFGDFGTVSQVYADLYCDSKTVSIPDQSVPGNMEITGTGTFTTSPFKLLINYHLTNGSANEYCSTSIQ